MIDLNTLILILKSYGVKSYEFEGLRLEFHVEPLKIEEPTKDHTIEIPIDESQLPVDLRTDSVTSQDSILFWSGSPDMDPNEQLPLTGDAPLEGL